MKVKRVSYGYGYGYEVDGAKYIRVKIHYSSSTRKGYKLVVKRINQEYGYDIIFYSLRFNDLKNFLAKYDSERELIADYYMAKLEGKFTI